MPDENASRSVVGAERPSVPDLYVAVVRASKQDIWALPIGPAHRVDLILMSIPNHRTDPILSQIVNIDISPFGTSENLVSVSWKLDGHEGGAVVVFFCLEVEALVFGAESSQIDQMNNRWNRTVDEILLLRVDIHVRDRPVNILSPDTLNLLPVIGIFCVEKDNVTLTRAVVQISIRGKSSAINSRIRYIMCLK